jgi:L-iditol 2-dehydrogenase
MCFKLPENVSTLEGALMEPFSVGIHSANLGKVRPGKTAAILGGGCIGLMTLLACKMMGVSKVIIADLYQNRLNNALELGADIVIDASKEDTTEKILDLTHGEGVDIVFETAGSPRTAYQTSTVVRRGGCIVLAGNIIGDISFNFRNMTLKEAELKTVWRYRNTYPQAIEAVSRGIVNLKALRVETFAFMETQRAFERAMTDKQTVVKAVIQF